MSEESSSFDAELERDWIEHRRERIALFEDDPNGD